jgi:protein tyrosine/serine phosphatase
MVVGRSGRRHAGERCASYVPLVVRTAQTTERPLVLEGCANFRDVGALPTANGATVRSGRLFRSNALIAATPDDRRVLASLGITTVIDLRSDDEVAWSDDPVIEGARRHHLPLGDLLGGGDDWECWHDAGYVADRYFDLCRSGSASIVEVFAVLTDPASYPVVVQCSLGKDRTGVVVGLVLRAIGVPIRHIAEEYARSQHGAWRIVEALHAQLDEEHRRALGPYLPALLAADPLAMVRFLGRVDDEYGSVTGYLRHLDIVSAIPFIGASLVE